MIGINCFEYARILLRKQQERERESTKTKRLQESILFFSFLLKGLHSFEYVLLTKQERERESYQSIWQCKS